MNARIERRLKRIEDTLGVNEKERTKVVVVLTFRHYGDISDVESLGPIQQWETYKQAIAQS